MASPRMVADLNMLEGWEQLLWVKQKRRSVTSVKNLDETREVVHRCWKAAGGHCAGPHADLVANLSGFENITRRTCMGEREAEHAGKLLLSH